MVINCCVLYITLCTPNYFIPPSNLLVYQYLGVLNLWNSLFMHQIEVFQQLPHNLWQQYWITGTFWQCFLMITEMEYISNVNQWINWSQIIKLLSNEKCYFYNTQSTTKKTQILKSFLLKDYKKIHFIANCSNE